MKCPYCEENVWEVTIRPDVNLLGMMCLNCGCIVEINHVYDELKPVEEPWRPS